MRNIMYLRPGNMFKEFIVEESRTTVLENGRAVLEYSTERGIVISGCLALASTQQIARFSQLGRSITHTLINIGRPMAKADDRLHFADKTYLVKGVDEAGSLGVCTIYYVEERNDVK